MTTDPRSLIAAASMSRFQILAVALCVMLNALDGFDVLAITFAAPGIAKEWALAPGALGVVISASLAGMVLGSIALAPLADILGRRPVILISLAAMSVGMLLSSTATNVYPLAAWRILTGVGVGGMLAAITAMTAEYSNERHRGLCVSLMTIGYPLGGVLGGLMTVWLLQHFDWRAIFVFGGGVSVLLIPIVWRQLPESIEFLVTKRSAGAAARINRVLSRMRQPEIEALPPVAETRRDSIVDVFRGQLLARMLAVSIGYSLHVVAFYYFLGWIPSTVAGLGFTPAASAGVSVWANLGGILSGACFGYAARFVSLKALTVIAMVGSALMIAVFGRVPPNYLLLCFTAFIVGFCLFGGIVCLYTSCTRVFPAAVRATGTGVVIGVGRFGGMLGPMLGGVLLAAGIDRATVAMVMGSSAVLAAISMATLPAILMKAPERRQLPLASASPVQESAKV